VVDDGVATGGTAVAALRWANAQGAETVILAVPVAPPQTIGRLRHEADEVVALATPEPFFAVGECTGSSTRPPIRRWWRRSPGRPGAAREGSRARPDRLLVLGDCGRSGSGHDARSRRRRDGPRAVRALRHGRVGLWFAFAGLFAIYASSDATGRAAFDELAELRWYSSSRWCCAMQLGPATSGRRRPERTEGGR